MSLESAIGAVLGGSGHSSRPSGTGAYAPLATALIGLLAAKAATGGFGDLGSLLRGGGSAAGSSASPAPPSVGVQPEAGPGGLLGGLGGLLHQFQQNGQGQVAQSWVGTGSNQPATPDQIHQAIGPDMIKDLAQKMGISEQDVASRLSQELPEVVDKLTPQGRMPTHQESSSWL